MPVNDIYTLNVDMSLFGVELTNVHTFIQQSPDPGTPPGISLISAYSEEVMTDQIGYMSPDCQVTTLRARRLHPNPTQSVFLTENRFGQATGNSHPANVAAIGTLYGKDEVEVPLSSDPVVNVAVLQVVRAAVRLAGIPLAQIIEGVVEEATRALILTFLKKLISQISDAATGTQWQRVIWRPTHVIATEVIDVQTKAISKKLRSRTQGVGQ